MQSLSPQFVSSVAPTSQASPPRLRAIVEIIDGELSVIPIADCDSDERAILDAFRFIIADGGDR
jgi:hypothetical protein